jgi:cytochrome c-type biogenesis protein CcmE
MRGKRRLIIGLIVLGVFGALAAKNLNRTITPYVSFAEAKASERPVQVAGFPDHPKAYFDRATGLFRFTMTNEDGDVLPVSYKGARPGNFDQAQSVVVVGRYHQGTLEASQILVKCPSKYQAEEEAGMHHPGATDSSDETGTGSATKPASTAAETD